MVWGIDNDRRGERYFSGWWFYAPDLKPIETRQVETISMCGLGSAQQPISGENSGLRATPVMSKIVGAQDGVGTCWWHHHHVDGQWLIMLKMAQNYHNYGHL